MKKLLALLLVIAVSVFAQNFTVNFNCKLAVAVKKAKFAYGTDKLVVRGPFNSWGGVADELTEGTSNDTIYSLAKQFTRTTAGQPENLEFKYVIVKTSGDTWEDGNNRTLTVPASATTVTYTAWFNNDSIAPSVTPKAIQVKFTVNMEYELGSGRFNPPDDSVSVNGSFNGWAAKKDVLIKNSLNPNLYSKTISITAAPGDKIEYKFWYEPGTWEGIDNRTYTFTQADYTSASVTLPTVYFNNASLTTLTANPVNVKLTCNTNGAKAANGYTFQNVQTVHVAGSSKPLAWPGGGWPTSDANLMIQLYDDGTNGDATAGDKIFSRIITFPKYTVLNVEYKYSINFGNANDNSGVNDNEGSVGGNHILELTPDMLSCTTVDTFGLGLGKKSFLKDVVTGVEVVDNVKPSAYTLEQNYPNPFNPSTNIKFALANAGFTTLKVYDMLGREVATLVNENLSAGTYNVNFEAANLTTGIYVYELRSGNVKISKKMMLVK